MSETWDSKQKKELLKELEILSSMPASGTKREKTIPRGRKPVKLSGEQGILWQAKSIYIKEIAVSATALAGKRVYGGYGGAIVVVKNGNRVFVFHLMTEWDYFKSTLIEALKIISTLNFKAEDRKKEKVEG